MATSFDVSRLKAGEAPPVPLGVRVRQEGEGEAVALSASGALAYLPGTQQFDRRLVWVDRQGRSEPLPAPVRGYVNVVISPDGRYAAVDVQGPTANIWVHDLGRNTLTQLTSGGSSQAPVWTPDGKRVVYRGTRAGFRNLFWKPADGSGEEERLTTDEGIHTPSSWSPDGKWLAFVEMTLTGGDLWVLPIDGDRKPRVFLKTPFNEVSPRFSPDGQWLAYASDESSRTEIYVRPFPGPGAKSQISTDGGIEPLWSRDGRELFYVNGDKMMAVDISTRPTLTAGTPRVLFEGRSERSPNFVTAYDVSADGRRFLKVRRAVAEQTAAQVNVVVNWLEELKARVPLQ